MNSQSQDSQTDDDFNKKYLKLQKIAEGTYGIVWKGKNKQTGQIFAIKVFKNVSNQGLPVSAVRQIHILKKLNSPYILQPIELGIKPRSVSMVTQWKDLSLNKVIKSSKVFNCKKIIKQILIAIDTVHNNFVMHRDLKPANIVLDDEQGNNLKIIDFGMAKQIKWNKNIQLTNEVGTLYYRAPELLQGKTNYTKAIDVWAIGCIFYELLTKQFLFKGQNQTGQLIQIYESIATDQQALQFLKQNTHISQLKLNYWQHIKQTLKLITPSQNSLNLLKSLLQINPNKRISCKQALQHPYFTLQQQ